MKHLLSLSLLVGLLALSACDQAGPDAFADAVAVEATEAHVSAAKASSCPTPSLTSVYNRVYPDIGPHATMLIQSIGIDTGAVPEFEGQNRVRLNSGQYGGWGSLINDAGYLYDNDSMVAPSRPATSTEQYRVRAVCGAGSVSGWSNVRTVLTDPAY